MLLGKYWCSIAWTLPVKHGIRPLDTSSDLYINVCQELQTQIRYLRIMAILMGMS